MTSTSSPPRSGSGQTNTGLSTQSLLSPGACRCSTRRSPRCRARRRRRRSWSCSQLRRRLHAVDPDVLSFVGHGSFVPLECGLRAGVSRSGRRSARELSGSRCPPITACECFVTAVNVSGSRRPDVQYWRDDSSPARRLSTPGPRPRRVGRREVCGSERQRPAGERFSRKAITTLRGQPGCAAEVVDGGGVGAGGRPSVALAEHPRQQTARLTLADTGAALVAISAASALATLSTWSAGWMLRTQAAGAGPPRPGTPGPSSDPLQGLADADHRRQEPAGGAVRGDAPAGEHEADLGVVGEQVGCPSAASSRCRRRLPTVDRRSPAWCRRRCAATRIPPPSRGARPGPSPGAPRRRRRGRTCRRRRRRRLAQTPGPAPVTMSARTASSRRPVEGGQQLGEHRAGEPRSAAPAGCSVMTARRPSTS